MFIVAFLSLHHALLCFSSYSSEVCLRIRVLLTRQSLACSAVTGPWLAQARLCQFSRYRVSFHMQDSGARCWAPCLFPEASLCWTRSQGRALCPLTSPALLSSGPCLPCVGPTMQRPEGSVAEDPGSAGLEETCPATALHDGWSIACGISLRCSQPPLQGAHGGQGGRGDRARCASCVHCTSARPAGRPRGPESECVPS